MNGTPGPTPAEDLQTPADLPIACSLTAAAKRDRVAEIAGIGRASLMDVATGGQEAILRFRAGAGTRRRLAAIVAAEAECCPFLTMDLREERGVVTLTITAPPGAEPIVDELAAAFGARPPTA